MRTDRSGKTHPWNPCNPKKNRRNGGGVLRRDIDIESTQVGLIKVQAEILTVNFKLPTGNKFSISTLYRVGNLGTENFEAVKNILLP